MKSKLVSTSNLKAADHYLVVDDSAMEIEVEVWHGEYPSLSIIKNGGYVLAKKITGSNAADQYQFDPKLNEIKYRDFKDRGNIIRDDNEVGWIVDTEWKSFDAPELNRESNELNQYLKNRFAVTAGEDYNCLRQIFKISISSIGLK